jgi:hypothetical protein
MPLAGTVLAPQVARLFGIHELQLGKHPSAEGLNFQVPVSRTRFDLVIH